jgi:hypothetical protein
MDIIRAGGSVMLSEPPLYEPHLWFILTNPDRTGRIVAVMLRSAKPYTDPTLVLDVGDHPFIRHPSAVDFAAARWFTASEVRAAFKSGRCHLNADMSPELLLCVRAKLLVSPRTVRVLADSCRKLWSHASP